MLISLGGRTYLEIVEPDPLQPQPKRPQLFGIDTLKAPRLVTWAAHGSNLAKIVENAKRRGVELGSVLSARRQRPDGFVLSWQMTGPSMPRADGLVPFFIDWGTTAHPAKTAIAGCTLSNLRAVHPHARQIQAIVTKVGDAPRYDRTSLR